MLDPVLDDEQPHPIRRAAANLTHAHRYVRDRDERCAEAITLAGIVTALDQSIRALGTATHVEDLWTQARALMKHAETVMNLRDHAAAPRKVLMPAMNAAHDALLEAADKLASTDRLTLPF
jgi:hypothetical protein